MSGLSMLVEPIETSLLGALAPLVARQPALVLGAGPGAHDGPTPALVVCVHGLQHTPRDAPGAERQSPRLAARPSPQPADDARSWTIAGAQAHELAEVLTPDRVLVRGEDWTAEPIADGALLRLRTALPPGVAPVVWVFGALARGYQSRGTCVVELSIVATAGRVADADALMGAALCLGLPVLAALPPLEALWGSFPAALPPGPGVRVRMDRPEVTLCGQVRRWVPGAPGHAEVRSALTLTGELELTVAVGAPEPAGVIHHVVGQLIA